MTKRKINVIGLVTEGNRSLDRGSCENETRKHLLSAEESAIIASNFEFIGCAHSTISTTPSSHNSPILNKMENNDNNVQSKSDLVTRDRRVYGQKMARYRKPTI